MQYYGTLGPACGETGILRKMLEAGMTGVRLNLSHGDLKENGHWLHMLSEAVKCSENRDGRKLQILIDLCGPEVRLGRMEGKRKVEKGESVIFGRDGIPVPEPVLINISNGDHMLIDDGKLEFVAEETDTGESREKIRAKALYSGEIQSGKSLAVVGKEIPMPTLTKSDYENIRQAVGYGVTGVMLPFVRRKEDLLTLRKALEAAGAAQIDIFAKIENLRGVKAIDELLPYCDQIVIARGDLGNAMPLWKLPGVQKKLAEKCRAEKKPFMVVTQMLDSMHERPVPTRAEVMDIYNAVLDGASSLMLTGETAVGKYPAEAMAYLVKTGEEACHDVSFNSCSQR